KRSFEHAQAFAVPVCHKQYLFQDNKQRVAFENKFQVVIESRVVNLYKRFGLIAGTIECVKEAFKMLQWKYPALQILGSDYCKICFDKGHSSKDCLSCSLCMDLGHKFRDCPKNKNRVIKIESPPVVTNGQNWKEIHDWNREKYGVPKEYSDFVTAMPPPEVWTNIEWLRGLSIDVEKVQCKKGTKIHETNAALVVIVAKYRECALEMIYKRYINNLSETTSILNKFTCVEYSDIVNYGITWEEAKHEIIGLFESIPYERRPYRFKNEPIYLFSHSGVNDLQSIGISVNELPNYIVHMDIGDFFRNPANKSDKVSLKDLTYYFLDRSKIQEYNVNKTFHSCVVDAIKTWKIGTQLANWRTGVRLGENARRDLHRNRHIIVPNNQFYNQINYVILMDKHIGLLPITEKDFMKIRKGTILNPLNAEQKRAIICIPNGKLRPTLPAAGKV
ncbi:hypothetical protein B4U80_13486, partial [Leptotrombidium deliense]